MPTKSLTYTVATVAPADTRTKVSVIRPGEKNRSVWLVRNKSKPTELQTTPIAAKEKQTHHIPKAIRCRMM